MSSSRFNDLLWNSGSFGGPVSDPPDAAIPVSGILGRIYPRLHAAGASDLVFWTETQLLLWIDRAAKRLARATGVFVKRTATATANGDQAYPLPADHVSTIHTSVAAAALRPANTAELQALDDAWQTTPGTPKRWYEDLLGLAEIGLYPVPTVSAELAIIHHHTPPQLAATTATLAAPLAVSAYIEYSVVAEACSVGGDGAAPDIAQSAAAQAELYEQVIRSYWGGAQ